MTVKEKVQIRIYSFGSDMLGIMAFDLMISFPNAGECSNLLYKINGFGTVISYSSAYGTQILYFFAERRMDLNKVMLIGRSTTDVEIKKIESTGNSVVNFTVATNRRYRNRDEQTVEESEYHRCVAYGNAADIIGKYVNKGKRIYVEGRLRTRKWEDTTGASRYTTEIVVDNFIFLDSKPHDDMDDSNVSDQDDDLPF